MKNLLGYLISLFFGVTVVLFATPTRADEAAPPEDRRHSISAHITSAPIYATYIATYYEPTSGFAPLNLGLRVDYEYAPSWVHVGLAVQYDYVLKFDTHELVVPLVVTMEKKSDGGTIGATIGAGYYGAVSEVFEYSGSLGYLPVHGVHVEALFSYRQELPEGVDFSFRTGINAAMATIGDGDKRLRLSLPLEIGLRKRW